MEKTVNIEQSKALKLIERFNPKCLDKYGAFQQIDRHQFLNSLRELIHQPASITQGEHPLCGIASAVKIAAELDPVNLVKMSAWFYARGKYEPGSFLRKKIAVPQHIKNATPVAGLSPANHVLQTTIKSFFNPITGYNNKPGSIFNEWQGITFPHQLRQFLTNYFRIKTVPVRTYRHTIEELQLLLQKSVKLLAWTSWNQMKNPGGRFKLLEQHYVLIKSVQWKGQEVELIIDNPRKKHDQYQQFMFPNERAFYKAIIGVYAFDRA